MRIRSLFQYLAALLPFNPLHRTIGNRVLLPFYHLVSDNPPAHVKHLYRVLSVKEFTQQLDFLLKYYTPIDAHTLVKYSQGQGRIGKPSFFLSFDDGFREVKEVVAPILLAKGIPATFFVNPLFIGNSGLMHRCKISLIWEELTSNRHLNANHKRIEKYLRSKSHRRSTREALLSLPQEQMALIDYLIRNVGIDIERYCANVKPYLTVADVQELAQKGFTIGGHGYDHLLLSGLSLNEQVDQVEKCMGWIAENTPPQPRLFAFPFTDYGVKADLFRFFYQLNLGIIDLSFGTMGIRDTPFCQHFQRLPMEVKHHNAKSVVGGEILYYIAKRLVGRG